MTRRFNVALPAFLAIALFSSSSDSLAAQTGTLPNGPAAGASVDRFIYEDAGITAVSFRYSRLRARQVGTEIGISLFPDALSAGSLYLAPDLGAALNIPGSGFSGLLKAGVSALTGLGGGFAFQPGYHFGGGMIVQTGKRSGVRLDVIRHYYLIDNETEGLWSVGLGFTVLGGRSTATP